MKAMILILATLVFSSNLYGEEEKKVITNLDRVSRAPAIITNLDRVSRVPAIITNLDRVSRAPAVIEESLDCPSCSLNSEVLLEAYPAQDNLGRALELKVDKIIMRIKKN